MPSGGPLVAVVGLPGAWSSERLRDALRDQGAESFIVPITECAQDCDTGQVRWGDRRLNECDGVVVKKLGGLTPRTAPNRLALLEELEAAGVPIISSSVALGRAIDRFRNTQWLRRAGVPMPRAVVSESLDVARATLAAWGRVVLKPLFTTKARGMELLTAEDDPTRVLIAFAGEHGAFYLQEFVDGPGWDIGVILCGTEVLGAFKRVADGGQWKTTTAAGGQYRPFDLPSEAREIAVAAAEAFGLDFTGIDLVRRGDEWLVYEASAFGGFRGLHEAGGPDAAVHYARRALARIADA